MTKVRLSLSVSDTHLNKINEVATAAERVGMKVEQRLSDIGVLTGVIDQGKVDRLRRVAGISEVEEERTFRVPPPDSPIQ